MRRGVRAVLVAAVVVTGVIVPAEADVGVFAFEPPVYHLGSIHGQDGWSVTGPYDQSVFPTKGEIPGWGAQAFRISNAVTSGTFGDQTFSRSVANEAGEFDAVNGGLSGGTRVRRFDARWQMTSAFDVVQPGLSIDISPDRGDGARMSLLRVSDEIDGLQVELTQYRSGLAAPGCASSNFVTSTVATRLPRRSVHSIRIVMDLIDGPKNDVVQVYVNNALRATGTTWEDFFRECQAPGSRTVDSLLFRATGPACSPSCSGRGFLFDNVSVRSVGAVVSTGGGVAVTEGGPPDSYTIRLESQPSDLVRIDLIPTRGVSVSPQILFFSPSNYTVPQVVSVTAVDDGEPEPAAIEHIDHNVTSLDGTFDGAAVDVVPVAVTDDDGVFIVKPTEGSTQTAEWGLADFYTMRLLFAPSSDVTIAVAAGPQLTVTPASVTFTPLDWNQDRTLRVDAVDDADVEGTHAATVTHSATAADPAFDGQPVPSLPVTIFDNDPNVAPPAPVISCPGTITSKSHLLTGTAQPGTAVDVFVDGAPYGSVGTDAAGNWSVLLAFSSNGTRTITARAVNISGTEGPFSDPCDITVAADFAPPAAPTIASPAQGAFTGSAVTVTGTAFADTIEIRLFDAGVEIARSAAAPGTWSIPATFPTGLHTLTARAVDAAGNVSGPSNVRSFTADGDAPSIVIFTPPNSFLVQPVLGFAPYTIRGTATDTLAGLGSIELRYEDLMTGDVVVRAATCPASCSAAGGANVSWSDDPPLAPGLYAMRATASDRVGNTGFDEALILFVS